MERTMAKMLIPPVQLYGLYVIAHGENGPGGGFQGGVILGASLILYVLVYGLEAGKKRISRGTRDFLLPCGALIYVGIGVACLLAGGNFLEYSALPLGNPKHATHLGILGVEIGIGITVAAVMITLFFETARQDEE
jgi:multicomponent Na+:H+ antiporter subunit B